MVALWHGCGKEEGHQAKASLDPLLSCQHPKKSTQMVGRVQNPQKAHFLAHPTHPLLWWVGGKHLHPHHWVNPTTEFGARARARARVRTKPRL